MKSANGKEALVSGASIAGLSTAYWLAELGYHVTVVELANEPRLGGAAINLQGRALDSAKRMGIFEQLTANRLQLERLEFKNTDDVTEGAMSFHHESAPQSDDDPEEIEIERDKLVPILLGAIQNKVDFLFSNRITRLSETADAMHVAFATGASRTFDLVCGCDGAHSGVRKLWFGPETEYAHFMGCYFSLTIVNTALVAPNTAQLYSVPGKGIMLNTYNGKTDIIFWFSSEEEISYDYRDTEQQQKIVAEQFVGQGWRTAELLEALQQGEISYFDKFCQIKMPSWTKGRVVLVGDAGYCASPAAGVGASLAMGGAAALAEALSTHDDNLDLAFQAYNHALRPHVEEVQATALTMLREYFVPSTEEAIHRRNTRGIPM